MQRLVCGHQLGPGRDLRCRHQVNRLQEGVAFGLYTTTGRAVSFLAPVLFSVFIAVFGTDRAGMGGILVVLAAGLSAMLFVRAPRRVTV